MDLQNIQEKYRLLPKKHLLPLILGFFGLILIGYGLISSLGSKSASDIKFESAELLATESAKTSTIAVDIEGGVMRPGVYKVLANSRVQDALIAAGGLSASADRAWVAKNLNLALKVTDGVKIYIPLLGESLGSSSNMAGGSGQIISGDQININTASESQLDSLPGIGPVTAQKIISGRPYLSVDELLSKKVLSSSVFGKIKDRISL